MVFVSMLIIVLLPVCSGVIDEIRICDHAVFFVALILAGIAKSRSDRRPNENEPMTSSWEYIPVLGRRAESEHSAVAQGDVDATLSIYLPEENSCSHEQL